MEPYVKVRISMGRFIMSCHSSGFFCFTSDARDMV